MRLLLKDTMDYETVPGTLYSPAVQVLDHTSHFVGEHFSSYKEQSNLFYPLLPFNYNHVSPILTSLTHFPHSSLQVPVPPAPEKSSGNPKFTLAVLILVGVCAFIGVTWTIIKLFRIFKRPTISLSPTSSLASSRDSTLRRSGSLRSNAVGGGPDIERGDVLDTATSVERSDSMVLRASAWARAILAGPVTSSPPSHGSNGNGKTRNTANTMSIPVKHAVVVLQPDGEPSLGIASEIQQKDVMVQVDERELLEHSIRSSMRRQRSGNLISRSSSGIDQATQAGSQGSSPSSSRAQLAMEDVGSVFESSGSIRRRVLEAMAHRALDTNSTDNRDDVEGSGEVSHHGHRRRKRRRKRRKGTTEASCQTDESSFS